MLARETSPATPRSPPRVMMSHFLPTGPGLSTAVAAAGMAAVCVPRLPVSPRARRLLWSWQSLLALIQYFR